MTQGQLYDALSELFMGILRGVDKKLSKNICGICGLYGYISLLNQNLNHGKGFF